MPGGFQLGNAFGFLQGVLLGAGTLWSLIVLIFSLCGLQLIASIFSRLRRANLVQWILRLVLLVTSAAVALFFGLALYVQTLPPDPVSISQRGTPPESWLFFIQAVVWFAFIPAAAIFIFSLRWILQRAIKKAVSAMSSASIDKTLPSNPGDASHVKR